MTALLPTDLLGAWALDRVVLDRRAGARSAVTGTTTLTLVGRAVRWTERGTMTTDGASVPVSRTLSIVPDTGGGWTVLFADGREFHRWAPGETVVHDCAPDVYTGLVTGTTAGWQVLWEASGPAKDYRIESTLSREGAAPVPGPAPGPAPAPAPAPRG